MNPMDLLPPWAMESKYPARLVKELTTASEEREWSLKIFKNLPMVTMTHKRTGETVEMTFTLEGCDHNVWPFVPPHVRVEGEVITIPNSVYHPMESFPSLASKCIALQLKKAKGCI